MKVGCVLGTKPSTPLEFWVYVNNSVQLDSCIVVKSKIRMANSGQEDFQTVTFYGIVDTVEKQLEGLNFNTDMEYVDKGIIPSSFSHIAHITVTRREPDLLVPPNPGDAVYLANEEEFKKALYFDNMSNTIPAGLTNDNRRVDLNFEFIDGTKGAHILISGMSGIATKTSYALFLLNNIFLKDPQKYEGLIFNVKGEDLLYLDKKNKRFRTEDASLWKKLGVENPQPFKNTKFFTPPSDREDFTPDTKSPKGKDCFVWSMREFAENSLFEFLFPQEAEETSNIRFAVDNITQKLFEFAEKQKNTERGDKNYLFIRNQEIRSLEELGRFLRENQWMMGSAAPGTVAAVLRRLDAAGKQMSKIVYGGENKIPEWKVTKSGKIHVFDISNLRPIAQFFVVGATLKKLFIKKSRGDRFPITFVILDELNKYAPKGKWTPLKDILIDIAQRGRSLSIVLIGAQQNASDVERSIITNAAIKVVGRLDVAEAQSKEYDFLIGTFKKRAVMLTPGSLILYQPDVPSPVLVRFPFPPWATRADEVEVEREMDGFSDFANV